MNTDSWRSLLKYVMGLSALLWSIGWAHEGHLELLQVKLVQLQGQTYLTAQVKYPDDEPSLILQAVSTPNSSAVFERKTLIGWEKVKHIPITSKTLLGTDSPYRIRFDQTFANHDTIVINLLFDNGAMQTISVQIGALPISMILIVGLVVLALSALGYWWWVVAHPKPKPYWTKSNL